jgi:hypothetical protein
LPAETAPSPTALASGEPQPTATALAIISDIVVVGETAAYSPDGTMLAFSARPADGSAGPDIYLWRVGEAAAQPITSDHGSVFSGWLSNQLLGSRAVDEAGRPTFDGGSSPFAPASGAPDSSAEPSASDVPIDPLASESPSGEASPTTGAAGSADPSPSSDGDTGGSSATGIAGTAMTVAFQIVARPAAAAAGGAQPTDPPTGAAPAAAPIGRDGPVPPTASARSFILDPGSGAETSLLGPAWRPVVDPTGRFVAYWAGSLRYDASALSWLPDRGALVLASWPALRGAGPTGALDAIPLLGNGPTDIPAGEWDVRWDETGTHIAIWLADADNPELGRLSLLTVDASGRIDPRGIALHDAPALPGFSIGNGRLAWATTPGQDGEGSRLQVLAWSGANAGKIDSQPVSGDSAVVVVR